jgi:hypothetical protein
LVSPDKRWHLSAAIHHVTASSEAPKFTPDTGPMPADFAVAQQATEVKQHPANLKFSEFCVHVWRMFKGLSAPSPLSSIAGEEGEAMRHGTTKR